MNATQAHTGSRTRTSFPRTRRTCAFCGDSPRHPEMRRQLTADHTVSWWVVTPQAIREERHCQRCAPTTPVTALDCQHCADGPLVVASGIPHHTALQRALGALRTSGWTGNHPTQLTCPHCQPEPAIPQARKPPAR